MTDFSGNALRKWAALACIGLLIGCSEEQFEGSRQSPLLANEENQVVRGDGNRRLFGGLFGRTGDRRSLGTDDFLGISPSSSAPLVQVAETGEITLNLVDVPIEAAAKAVLSDSLGFNYSIEPGVSGRITLQTTRPLTEQALLETFLTVLQLNGATLQTAGDLVLVKPIGSGVQRIAVGEAGAALGDRVVALPLQYIGTEEMLRLLEPISGSTVRFQSITNRNILLVSGNREEVNAAIEAVNLFDVDVLKGKSVGVFPLKAAEPEAIVEELNVIFESGPGGSLENVVNFVPSQRLGAVIVVTTRANYLSDAERWIRDLDSAAGGAQRRPAVYSLENRSAVDLAPILAEMVQDASSESEATLPGAPRIVADDTKNAIIVWGNDPEQQLFGRLLQSLDSAPVQVLLEATIAEVSLNDELNFGLRWFFENGNLSATFSDASTGAVGSNFPGLSLLFDSGSADVALNALSSITEVDVVSSPSLLVLDNQEARLQIGDEVPIATQEVRDTSDPNAPVVTNISLRDTGIILSVRPRVSTSGQVVLDIEQEVSSVASTTTSGIDSPTISQRRIETSVAVKDGQTIALGGLIQDDRNRTTSRVPGLGDAPIIGPLFRNREDSFGRTELLVLISPRVIRNGQEARSITQELRGRIVSADGLIRSGISKPTDGHRIVD